MKLRHGRRLSAADASNVVMDARDQVNVFLMAGVLGVGGFVAATDAVDMEQLRSTLAARLADPAFEDLARLRQRVRWEGGAPRWEACTPDLARHVRLVDPVAGREGLARLCGLLMTVPLRLDRPGWELLIVPGASAEGPGVILRVHHAVADGMAGIRLVQRLFDGAPAPEPAASGRADAAAPRRPGWRTFRTGVSRVLAVFRVTVPPTVLLGPIGPDRGVAFADCEVGALARAGRLSGATINDVLLAAVTVGAEGALRARGHPVPQVLPASVPVALPERGTSGNAVGVMLVPLPVGEPDPAVRLARITAVTGAAKTEARTQGTYELTRTRWGSRLFAWLARRQRFIALFVTNVHGPDRPLVIGGATLEHAWPVSPIQGNVRLGVAAMSYAGRFGVAVHADEQALGADAVARGLGDELSRIAGAATTMPAPD